MVDSFNRGQMARSLRKGYYVAEAVVRKVNKWRKEQKGVVQVYSRASTIYPECVGVPFNVHNGKKFVPVTATEDMIGHKFGEFSPTRTFKGHSGDKVAKKGK